MQIPPVSGPNPSSVDPVQQAALHQVWWLQTQVSDAIQAKSGGLDVETYIKEIETSINALSKMPTQSLGLKAGKILDQLQQIFERSNQQPGEQALIDLLNQAFDLESALKHH